MLKSVVSVLLAVQILSQQGLALDNGLAKTPPMGWLSWERFRCNIDCVNDPQNCISEKLFMTMADHMVADGYRDAGYEYVNIDDCWLAKERDAMGRLQPDPQRFPSGIKALADYMHQRGLKLGIYEDFGTKTCAGYPGSEYYLELDAQTFADWGVDYLKLDGCNSNPSQYSDVLPPMSYWLERTGRPIFLSCEYPLYQGGMVNYTKVAAECNLARNFHDISDSWESVTSIIKFYGANTAHFAEVAKPGFFNDPDMLIIGNYGLSYDQERMQMGMWAMMASPLIMSTDLRTIRPESKALLLHKNLIRINQDPMGVQGTRIQQIGNIDLWTKPITPKGSMAIAMVNYGTDGTPKGVTVSLKVLGLSNMSGYNVTEVFDGFNLGLLKPTSDLSVKVNPSGIYMVVATPA